MTAEDDEAVQVSGQPELKASGFFVSRGSLQSAEQIAEQARRDDTPLPLLELAPRHSPADGPARPRE